MNWRPPKFSFASKVTRFTTRLLLGMRILHPILDPWLPQAVLKRQLDQDTDWPVGALMQVDDDHFPALKSGIPNWLAITSKGPLPTGARGPEGKVLMAFACI